MTNNTLSTSSDSSLQLFTFFAWILLLVFFIMICWHSPFLFHTRSFPASLWVGEGRTDTQNRTPTQPRSTWNFSDNGKSVFTGRPPSRRAPETSATTIRVCLHDAHAAEEHLKHRRQRLECVYTDWKRTFLFILPSLNMGTLLFLSRQSVLKTGKPSNRKHTARFRCLGRAEVPGPYHRISGMEVGLEWWSERPHLKEWRVLSHDDLGQ